MRTLYLALIRQKDHLVFILALILSWFLLLKNDSPDILILRSKANDVFSVLFRPVAWIRATIHQQEEMALLQEQNLKLALQVESMLQLAAENKRLKDMLNYKRESTLTLLPAKVVGTGAGVNLNSISIDVGRLSGVHRNNPVITPRGVVGKTVVVGENTSIVQLLSDLNYRLSVRIMPGGYTGILRWVEGDLCEVREVQRNAKVQVGDKVVTSGFSDIYPKNLPVGKVIGILEEQGRFEKVVSVQIYESLGSLINVFVIIDQTNEVD